MSDPTDWFDPELLPNGFVTLVEGDGLFKPILTLQLIGEDSSAIYSFFNLFK